MAKDTHFISKNDNGNTPIKTPRYVKVDGQKVYLNPEQQKAWDKFINDVRNSARKDKSCAQPNYHLCFGDCEACPYHVQGKVLSTDSEAYGGGYATGPNSPVKKSRSPESIVMKSETCRIIYREAARLVKNGDRILYLKTVEERSTYEIAAELNMPQTTVNKYLNKLLKHIREHREELLD